MQNKTAQRWFTLFILAIGVGIIFQLPYIRETFYVPLQNAMGLTNQQMGLLSSGYATMATISYFIGGMVADKFSPRKLLTFSLVSTGILGLYFSTFPSFAISRLVFVLLGITTIITYWSALIKATRQLGDSSEQGRLFGLQEGIRGIANAILVFIMLGAFNHFADETIGVAWAIRVIAITCILIGLVTWFCLDESNEKQENTESVGELVRGLLQACKMPRVWLIVGVIFTTYSVYGLMGYISPYMNNVFKVPVETTIMLGGTRYIIQGFGGVIGGFLADKIGSRLKVILAGYIGIILSFTGYIMLPEGAFIVNALIGNFFIGMFVIYVMRSLYFSIIDDAGIDVALTGRVSGLASCLGYTPDIFMFAIVGGWIDKYAGKTGYTMMFTYGIVMAIIGMILGFTLLTVIKKSKVTGNEDVA